MKTLLNSNLTIVGERSRRLADWKKSDTIRIWTQLCGLKIISLFIFVWVILGDAQELLLVMYSNITCGCTLGTIWISGDPTWVGCKQGKGLTHILWLYPINYNNFNTSWHFLYSRTQPPSKKLWIHLKKWEIKLLYWCSNYKTYLGKIFAFDVYFSLSNKSQNFRTC